MQTQAARYKPEAPAKGLLADTSLKTLEEARRLVEQAIRLQKEALKADPENVLSHKALVAHSDLLGEISRKLNR